MSTTASKQSSHDGFLSNLFTDASRFIASLGTDTSNLETQPRGRPDTELVGDPGDGNARRDDCHCKGGGRC
jgi:hypothetical protein